MTNTTETTTAPPTIPREPDGRITTHIGEQTIIAEVFFNHDSAEDFQDKLLKVILAEEKPVL